MSRRTYWILSLIIAAGIFLRLYHVGLRSIWFDEAFTWRLIQFPWADMLHRATLDVHPPLYYIVAKSWAGIFGSSIVSLRFLSILLAAATAASAYLFAAAAWGKKRIGLLAAALVAFSPWQITFAWEARMYTLGTCLALLSAYFLLKAVRQSQQKPIWWLLYAAAAAALAYVHYYAFFTLAAQALWFLGVIILETRGRIGEMLHSRRLWLGVGAGLVAALIYAPWLPTFFRQNQQVQQAFWIPALERWSLPETVYRMFFPTTQALSHTGWGGVVTLLPLLGMIAILALVILTSLAHSRRRAAAADAAWLVVACAVLPFALSLLVSLTGRSLYQDRYFVFAHVFLLIAIAAVVGQLSWPRLRLSVTTLLLAVFLLAYVRYWQQLDILSHPGVHVATATVYSQVAPGEAVVVNSSFIYFSVYHYAQEEFHAASPLLYDPSGQLVHFSGGPIITGSDVIGPDIFTKSDVKGIWMVDTTGFGSSLLPLPANWKVASQSTYSEVFGYQGDIIVRHLQR